MIIAQAKFVSRVLYITDILVTVIAFFLAYVIREYLSIVLVLPHLYPLSNYYWLLLVIIPLWSILFSYFRVYRPYRTVPISTEIKLLSKVVLVGGLFVGSVAFLVESHHLSRSLILVFIFTNWFLFAVGRFFMRTLSRSLRSRGYNYRNVIIVGTNETAKSILELIERHGAWGLKVVGFVRGVSDDAGTEFSGHPVLGDIKGFETILGRIVVDEVVFALKQNELKELDDTLLLLEEQGVNTRVALDIFPHTIARVSIEKLDNVPFLSFSTVPTASFAMTLKRVFDIMFSFVILALALPLMIITAVVIKLTSPGPVFFSQKRCGMNNRTFTLYKFRSMEIDAEEKKKYIEDKNESDVPVFLIVDDPRVTKFGRFIRRTNIDELPQLWNVFTGDMSLIGPRPPLPDELARYKRWQRRRLSMKPGVVCLWQVSGNYVVRDFSDWVRMDLKYIDKWSLLLDAKIFLKTIKIILVGRGRKKEAKVTVDRVESGSVSMGMGVKGEDEKASKG